MSIRIEFRITGLVQGMGIRPKILRMAKALGITGRVLNESDAVLIEAQSQSAEDLEKFVQLIGETGEVVEKQYLPPVVREFNFSIDKSQVFNPKSSVLSPDRAICSECKKEYQDPKDRRFGFSFISCAECGPRQSLSFGMPYDRALTSWRSFPICSRCQDEYGDPENRRFHVQGISCPQCGPALTLKTPGGESLASEKEALILACAALKSGKIIAVKGISGFHLMCDASRIESIEELRRRKRRPAKPFAVMVQDISQARSIALVGEVEIRALESPVAPIVLLRRKSPTALLADAVAPGLHRVGIMLSSSAYYIELIKMFGGPLVATSGNRGSAPICFRLEQALSELRDIADLFLDHNLEIAHAADDSVVQVVMGEICCLRRGRGYPLRVSVKRIQSKPLVALGADLKNSIALGTGRGIVLSPYLGQLGSAEVDDRHRKLRSDWLKEYSVESPLVIFDLHPDYRSSIMASEVLGEEYIPVQHHCAHIAGVLAEKKFNLEPVIGVAWDGTGYGVDGSSWGSEVILFSQDELKRLASFRTFPLLGGDRASREPWRVAFSLLREANIPLDQIVSSSWWKNLRCQFSVDQMESLRSLSVKSSSLGRFFDGVSSLLEVRHFSSYEGQAAIELESMAEMSGETGKGNCGFAVQSKSKSKLILFESGPDGVLRWDWRAYIRSLFAASCSEACATKERAALAFCFHQLLAALLIEIIQKNLELCKNKPVILSGGVFQNALLLEIVVRALREHKIEVFWNKEIPSNDGGIAVGQIVCVSEYLVALRKFQQPK
ncbi:MAG: carbamoyltransferase HypF [Bdellovibrionales bacterium]|nr:carbamoyltransferase HypF [Bdellovibrionales bacterium]